MKKLLPILVVFSFLLLPFFAIAEDYDQSPFLIPQNIPSIGELQMDQDVTIKITLEEGPGADSLGTSTLSFETGLATPISWTVQLLDKEDNPVDTISRSSKDFTIEVDHQEFEKISVVLSGKAPVVTKRTQVTVVKILQTVNDGGNYETLKVVDIKSYVTSSDISDALTAIQTAEMEIEKAKDAINDAEKAGGDTSLAEAELQNAEQFLENAKSLYNAGTSGSAYLAAKNAIDSAKRAYEYAVEAKEKAEASAWRSKMIIYGAIGAIAVVVVIALILRQRGGFQRL
jgi:hypothetical protein